jgi:hypothetical protein
MTVRAAPGVILAVSTGTGPIENLIRAGEALEGKEAVANHVILVTHADVKGRWIGIQGQPGGVGLVDCTPFMSSPWARDNYAQIEAMAPQAGFPAQLTMFLASCAASLHVGYDWAGIGEDVAGALHLNDVSSLVSRIYQWDVPGGRMPGDFVCSSLAWWQYDHVGWAHPDPAPGQGETCEPADWWAWCDQELWTAAAAG